MTDRELLEAAAKAGCIVGEYVEDFDPGEYYYTGKTTGILVTDEDGAQWVWNPLTDDGDALRTAVSLNIPVFPYDDETSTGTVGVVAKNWGSKDENTRRAIVRAAAMMATKDRNDAN